MLLTILANNVMISPVTSQGLPPSTDIIRGGYDKDYKDYKDIDAIKRKRKIEDSEIVAIVELCLKTTVF